MPEDDPQTGVTEPAIPYAAAVAELDAVLRDLEADDIDVDELAAKVRRAAELIEICRSRIDRARVDVERIVASLEAPD